MGAFDGELYALGYRFEDIPERTKPVEIEPELGGRVGTYYTGNGLVSGTVMYLSDENIVIRLDEPYTRHSDPHTPRQEIVLPAKYGFYQPKETDNA